MKKFFIALEEQVEEVVDQIKEETPEINEELPTIDDEVSQQQDEVDTAASTLETTETIEQTIEKTVENSDGLDKDSTVITAASLEHFYGYYNFNPKEVLQISNENFKTKDTRLQTSKAILHNLKVFNRNLGKKISVAHENLMERRGIYNTQELEYLNNLKTKDGTSISNEGVIKAKVKEVLDNAHATGTELVGFFKNAESKKTYLSESGEDLIEWLKDKQNSNPNLSLDMGAFKTWMKTSQAFQWRYYFLLDDTTWNKVVSDLQSDKTTDIEKLYNIDFSARKNAAVKLDNISNIKGLISVVEEYVKRSDKFFDLVLKRKIKIKSAPFQVVLLGLADLRTTVKKIVNLAS